MVFRDRVRRLEGILCLEIGRYIESCPEPGICGGKTRGDLGFTGAARKDHEKFW